MTKTWHAVFHVIAIAAQIAVQASSLVPASLHPLVGGLIAVAQAAVALYNHTQPS
jgi:hypothetical protein